MPTLVPGSNLDGLVVELPNTGGATSYYTNCPNSASVTTTFNGTPGVVYNTTLRFRGVVEPNGTTYSEGQNDGNWFQANGTNGTGPENVYYLSVSDPTGTYYLNREPNYVAASSSNYFPPYVFAIDYTKTIPIAGGATVSLWAWSGWPPSNPAELGQEDANGYSGGPAAISVAGITNPPQPYNGQFILMSFIASSDGAVPIITSSVGRLDVYYPPIFQELRTQQTPYFNEIPYKASNDPLSTGSLSGTLSNLSSSWPFVQGVEITRQQQYDAGLVKIWSGEPGHAMLVANYGERGTVITTPFADAEAAYFSDASSVVKDSPPFPTLLFPLPSTITPINGDDISLGYTTYAPSRGAAPTTRYRTGADTLFTVMNGVIEPLAIRLQPSFYSTDVPRSANQVLGSFGNGNIDPNNAADGVVTVDYYDAGSDIVPFVDLSQNVNGYSIVSHSGSFIVTASLAEALITAPTFQPAIPEVPLGAFSDARYVRNVPAPSSEDTYMLGALSLMTGSTDNYVSFDRRSATCGWYYDNTTSIGTDSITFGGMTH